MTNTSAFFGSNPYEADWSTGWTQAKVFRCGGKDFLLLIKKSGYSGSDHNVHIHRMLANGRVGTVVKKYRWSQGWTHAEFYTIGSATYLLLSKYGNGRVHVHRMNANGTVGTRLQQRTWTAGWSSIEPFRVGSKHYVFLLKALGAGSDGKNVHIHKLNADGTVGARVTEYGWSAGWTTAELFKTSQGTFLFLLKAGNGKARVYRMKATGRVGASVKAYDWSSGWTHARFFAAAGQVYLFLYKQGVGTVHVQAMRAGGQVGPRVVTYGKKASYTKAYASGSLANWGPRRWSKGWTSHEFFIMGRQPYCLRLKSRTGRVKTEQISPMVSVGPMVGAVTPSTARIWIGLVGFRRQSATVEVFPIRGRQVRLARAPLTVSKPDDYYRAAEGLVRGLKPDTRYRYRVLVDGKRFGSGSFRTAPSTSSKQGFQVVIASCMDLNDRPDGKGSRTQPAWNTTRADDPALLILGGDNAYVNSTSRSMQWCEHLQQRSVPSFAPVIANLPTYATWDDHDFGPNNSSGADVEKTNRAESMGAHQELFANPPRGQASGGGIYTSFRWGRVEFFLLDGRYFKHHYSRWPHDVTRQMLGPTQMKWLAKGLAASTATFKIVVSGLTFLRGATENWRQHTAEEKQLVSAMRDRGAVLVSGDVHKCHVRRLEFKGSAFWEVISSGISRKKVGAGYVKLDFSFLPRGEERIIVKIYNRDGSYRESREIPLADIT